MPADDRALQRLLDEARADEAASSRSRQRWLRQQAGEESSFAGTLLDLLEQRTAVTLGTVTGRQYHGVVASVAAGCVAVRLVDRRVLYLPVHAVASVRSERGVRATDAGIARGAGHDVTLSELLADAAAERRSVSVVTLGGVETAGVLRVAGSDVLTVQSSNGELVHFNLAAVTEIIVSDA